MNDAPQYDPLIQALRNLPPAPHALSRERLLFEAGRAAARPRFGWFWKGSSLFFAGSTAVLLILAADPGSQPAGVARRPFEPPASASNTQPAAKPPAAADSHSVDVPMPNPDELVSIHLHRDILEGGIESLPDGRDTGSAGA